MSKLKFQVGDLAFWIATYSSVCTDIGLVIEVKECSLYGDPQDCDMKVLWLCSDDGIDSWFSDRLLTHQEYEDRKNE
jgi:hypothetical protein